VVVLDEAGHFFLRYRAQEVVDIITTTHDNLPEEMAPPAAAPQRWWLAGVARTGRATDVGANAGANAGANGVAEPTMRRFGAVSVGQLISLTGTMLTAWAIPVWLYLTTGSLLTIGISGVSVVVPILLAT